MAWDPVEDRLKRIEEKLNRLLFLCETIQPLLPPEPRPVTPMLTGACVGDPRHTGNCIS